MAGLWFAVSVLTQCLMAKSSWTKYANSCFGNVQMVYSSGPTDFKIAGMFTRQVKRRDKIITLADALYWKEAMIFSIREVNNMLRGLHINVTVGYDIYSMCYNSNSYSRGCDGCLIEPVTVQELSHKNIL